MNKFDHRGSYSSTFFTLLGTKIIMFAMQSLIKNAVFIMRECKETEKNMIMTDLKGHVFESML